MVATTSWRCDCVSSAASFWSSRASTSGGMTLAASTTRPVSLGKSCADALTGRSHSKASSSAANPRPNPLSPGLILSKATRRNPLKLPFQARRDFGPRRRCLIGYHRLRAIKQLRADRIRERADRGVIGLHCAVVIADGHADAVLLPFQLALQHLVVADALQLWISLYIGEQAAEAG